MDSRAQAGGMEYILTYGWALVFLFTVVGVLILVTNSPSEKMTCTLSDNEHFIFKDFYIPFDEENSGGQNLYWGDNSIAFGFGELPAELVLQNVSNEPLKIKKIDSEIVSDHGVENCEQGRFFSWELVGDKLPGASKASFTIAMVNDGDISPLCGGDSYLKLGPGQDLKFQKIGFSLSGDVESEELFGFWSSARNSNTFLKITYEDAFGSEKSIRLFCSNFPESPF